MAGAGDMITYAVLCFSVRVPIVGIDDSGWDPNALRNAQICLAVVSGLAVVLSTISGEEPADLLTRPALGASLYNSEDCPHFWSIAIPYGLAAAAYHQIQLVTPQLFFLYLGRSIENYHDGFWMGCLSFLIAGAIACATGWATQLCPTTGALRSAFCVTQVLSAVLLASFSLAYSGIVALMAVYSLTGIGAGLFYTAPFAVLGGCVPREQIGRHVALFVTFGIALQQIVQGDYFGSFMDIYYPWPHMWVFLAIAGFLGSGFPNTDRRKEDGGRSPKPTSPLLMTSSV
jgi:MFS family permease